jgi:predicted acyl esterase
MKKLIPSHAILWTLMVFISVDSVAQDAMAYIRQHYDKQEIYITMRDDVRLFTSIYSPKDKNRPSNITLPVLLK